MRTATPSKPRWATSASPRGENVGIDAVAFAASIAAGFSGVVSVSLSGAGADATNIILTTTEAYADASVLDSAGDIIVDASNTVSTIDATIVAASAALSIGGTVGVGASIGAALAANLIGFDEDDNRDGAVVQAYLKEAGVAAADLLDIDAAAELTVNALVFAGSVAIAGGTVGVAISGAGASSRNRIGADVRAYIDGDGASGINVGTLTIDADDSSHIVADTGAASVAASFGAAGGSASVGAALAENEIDNVIEAGIRNAADVTATTGTISISAVEDAIMDATTAAGAAAISISIGVSGSGAITTATNTLTSTVRAFRRDVDRRVCCWNCDGKGKGATSDDFCGDRCVLPERWPCQLGGWSVGGRQSRSTTTCPPMPRKRISLPAAVPGTSRSPHRQIRQSNRETSSARCRSASVAPR